MAGRKPWDSVYVPSGSGVGVGVGSGVDVGEGDSVATGGVDVGVGVTRALLLLSSPLKKTKNTAHAINATRIEITHALLLR
jgi:hypothetical protein